MQIKLLNTFEGASHRWLVVEATYVLGSSIFCKGIPLGTRNYFTTRKNLMRQRLFASEKAVGDMDDRRIFADHINRLRSLTQKSNNENDRRIAK